MILPVRLQASSSFVRPTAVGMREFHRPVVGWADDGADCLVGRSRSDLAASPSRCTTFLPLALLVPPLDGRLTGSVWSPDDGRLHGQGRQCFCVSLVERVGEDRGGERLPRRDGRTQPSMTTSMLRPLGEPTG